MEFAGLRNEIEHAAAVIRHGGPGGKLSDKENAEVTSIIVLVAGQALVSIAESLHDIRDTLANG